MQEKPTHVAITGASSGLGAALAAQYAAKGITLSLQGRNAERLQEVADDCRVRGAIVHTILINVSDTDAMQTWLCEADEKMPINLVIANAGISAGTGSGGESAKQARELFRTNIDGVVNTISPLIPRMIARKSGQIALISSLAGIRGLPSSPAYSASKGWVRSYGDGLRGWLAKENVQVSVICPGFIKTPMTDVNPYHMPFLMSAEKAAHLIATAILHGKGFYAFPKALYVPLFLMNLLPTALSDRFFANLPDKPALPQ
jgi:short-subunit dehydrogenase